LHAVAVLGTGWVSALDAAEVAELDGAADAADRLESAGLLVARRGVVPTLRFAHALTHAAIYRQISLPDRRQMHLRAANVATSEEARLDHRIAAAERYDDELAAELEAFADRMYAQRSLRLATHYMNAGALLSHPSPDRGRRWLTARFLAVMSHEYATVHADADVARTGDAVRSGLVLGALAAFERRYQSLFSRRHWPPRTQLTRRYPATAWRYCSPGLSCAAGKPMIGSPTASRSRTRRPVRTRCWMAWPW
jgi:hypothetical protein